MLYNIIFMNLISPARGRENYKSTKQHEKWTSPRFAACGEWLVIDQAEKRLINCYLSTARLHSDVKWVSE